MLLVCGNICIVNQICGCGGTGRRAGLRNQCQRRGGSSPFIRTKGGFTRTREKHCYKRVLSNPKIEYYIILKSQFTLAYFFILFRKIP